MGLAFVLPPGPVAAAPAGDQPAQQTSLVARVRDTGFIQLTADSFGDLTQDQKMDAYWLYRASVAVDPIAYDQNSVYGLREKHLLESILNHSNGVDPAVLKKITEYTMLFWGNHGNHNTATSVKILPDFTAAELRAAAEQASKNGAVLGSATGLARELRELDKPFFDPAFEPMLIMKNPKNGQDPLEASSNNFYSGVTLKDLTGFTEHYALNSRLIMQDGKLVEEVYRTGTPDGTVPPGRYARELGRELPANFEVCNYYNINVNDDREAALAESKRFLDDYYTVNYTREYLERWCALGSPAECIANLQSFIDAGVTTITLRLTGYDQKKQFKRVTEEVLPSLL